MAEFAIPGVAIAVVCAAAAVLTVLYLIGVQEHWWERIPLRAPRRTPSVPRHAAPIAPPRGIEEEWCITMAGESTKVLTTKEDVVRLLVDALYDDRQVWMTTQGEQIIRISRRTVRSRDNTHGVV